MLNKFLDKLRYGEGYLFAKGDHDDAMNAINQARTQQTGMQNQLSSEFQNQYGNAYSSDTALRNQITQGYTNLMDPANIQRIIESSGLGGGTGVGGYNFGSLLSGIGGVSGGINPADIKNMGAEAYAGFKNLSTGGGISPEFRTAFDKSMADLDTGISSYKNFINTGGFSSQDIENMRAQAVAPTRQIYQQAQDEMTRQAAVAGGNVGNIAAGQARMAAEAADKIGQVNTATEANLAQMVQQGKEFGTTGVTQAAVAKAQAQTAVQQLDDQMRLAGLQGMSDIEKARVQDELYNAQINEAASAANAQIGLGKAGLGLEASKLVSGLEAGIPEEALKGLSGLYGTTPGATGLANKSLLDLLGLTQQGNIGLIGQQINASHIPGNFQQALGNIGGVLNLAGGFGGAISGLGGGLPRSLYPPGGGNPYEQGGYGYEG